MTGPGRNGGPLYGDTTQHVAALAHPKDAPKSNDYIDDYHHLNEDDYNQNQKVAHGKDLQAILDGDISHNDEDRHQIRRGGTGQAQGRQRCADHRQATAGPVRKRHQRR